MSRHEMTNANQSNHVVEAKLDALRGRVDVPAHNVLRWLVLLFLLFIVPMFGLGAWMYIQSEREVESSELLRDQLRARTLAAVAQKEMETADRILVSIADRRRFRQAWAAHDFRALEPHFQDTMQLDPDFFFVAAYDLKGTMLARYPPNPLVGRNFAYRDWYRGVSAQWKPYVSEVYRTAVAPNPLVVGMAVPILDEQNQPIGIFMSAYPLDLLSRQFKLLQAGLQGEPYIVDQRGIIAASPNISPTADPVRGPDAEAVRRALAGEEGAGRFLDNGREVFVGYAPIRKLGWGVIYKRPASEALASILRLRQRALNTGFYLLMIYLATALIASRLVRRQTRLLSDNRVLNEALEGRVAALKEAQEALRESEKRVRLVVETAQEAFVSMDEGGMITAWNPQAETTFGWKRAEAMGRSLAETIIPERYRDAHRAGLQRFLEMGEGPVLNKRLELTAIHRDGHEFPIEITISPLRVNHGHVFNAFIHDISERKKIVEALRESEERFRQLADNIQEVFWIMDIRSGRFLYVSPAFEHVIGVPREAVLADTGAWLKALHPDDQERVHSGFWKQGPRAEFKEEYRVIHPDGSERWVAVRSFPVRKDGNEADRVVGVARDITERKRAEDALLHAKEEAERVSRFKDQFLSTMSHELRTPLNAVLGFSELLTDERYGLLNDRQRRYLNHIQNGGKHLLTLINDILDLSRIESGRLEIAISDLRVNEAFVEVLSALRPLADAKSQTLEGEADARLVIRADLTRFKQVLMNLVGNAIKFTPQGGRIELAARPENGRIRIDVRDNGPGIAPEEQRRIFEAFYRIRKSGEAAEGSGLGLAITQRLVELQGGQLGLESEAEQGSCFYFTLQAAEAPRAIAWPAAAKAPAGTVPLILVVEDDALTASLIRSQLTSAGYAVEICQDGRRAHEAALALRPHAITLDILMEPVNGFEVLLEIKSDPRTAPIPVIVLTIVDQAAMGLTLGADEYLLKPVEKSVLLRAIRRCLGERGIAAPQRPILVVEDDAPTREAISDVLATSGYAVSAVPDGEAAREWMKHSLPEVVILDLLLPNISGFELLAEWRAAPRTADLPVFVLTAKDLTQEEEKYLRDQAEFLVRKQQPWQEELLLQLKRIGEQSAG
jgi:PAS domain S-box-containing protein